MTAWRASLPAELATNNEPNAVDKGDLPHAQATAPVTTLQVADHQSTERILNTTTSGRTNLRVYRSESRAAGA
jgi:hypothetical protein